MCGFDLKRLLPDTFMVGTRIGANEYVRIMIISRQGGVRG